ncbi:hypothetical protein QPK87_39115 [Kamptonema cortianum]|nr:hypothetical protein [Geitlerinema splendidum]MDK3162514.1 hypothetical protein [Kamptonema cortianum]
MKWIITGFGPFPGVDENPSAELVKTASQATTILDVTFRSVDEFIAQLAQKEWDAWLMVGVSGKANSMLLETVGRNIVGLNPDADGVIAPGPINPALPHQLSATLWHGLQGIAPEGMAWSTDAGNYLCNYTLYRGLSAFPDRQIGFLHIPTLDVTPMNHQASYFNNLIRCLESC